MFQSPRSQPRMRALAECANQAGKQPRLLRQSTMCVTGEMLRVLVARQTANGDMMGVIHVLQTSTIELLMTGRWSDALVAWRDPTLFVSGHAPDDCSWRSLLRTRVTYFERASLHDRSVSIAWLTAHLPLSLLTCEDVAVALHPRLALVLDPGILPDVSSGLWRGDMLTGEQDDWDSRLFAKVLPKRCRIRDFLSFVSGYIASAPHRALLMRRALLCTLLGLYPGTSGAACPSFETMRQFYSWLYVHGDRHSYWQSYDPKHEKATQHVCTLVVRELMIHLVAQLPALHCCFRTMWEWGMFISRVQAALEILRTPRDPGDASCIWDATLDRVALNLPSPYTIRARVRRVTSGLSAMNVMGRALARGLDSSCISLESIKHEMNALRAACAAGVTGLQRRIEHSGSYTDEQRISMACLLRALHSGASVQTVNKCALDLTRLSATNASLAARLLLETIVICNTYAVYQIALPSVVADSQVDALQKQWACVGQIHDLPQASAFLFCMGCKRIASRHIDNRPRTMICAHGSNAVDVDDATGTMWCSYRSSRESEGKSAMQMAVALLCKGFPLIATPVVGTLLVFGDTGYSVCDRCGHMTVVESLIWGTVRCLYCRELEHVDEPQSTDFVWCVLCQRRVRRAIVAVLNAADDIATSSYTKWHVCTKCVSILRVNSDTRVYAHELASFRQRIAVSLLHADLRWQRLRIGVHK